MTQGLQKSILNNFYEESIKKARQYLEGKYVLQECHKGDEDFPSNILIEYPALWKINVENKLHPLTLIIAIPKTFPDKLPKIYLSKKNHSELAPLPHVDKNRFVCTKDPNVAFINDNIPGEAIVALIETATEIINKGIRKENFDDFTEEFLAYWNEEAKHKFLSLFSPTDNINNLTVTVFSKNFLNSRYMIAKTKEETEKWLESLRIKIDKTYEALYLPLPKSIPIPLPQDNGDILKIIIGSGEGYSRALESYFNRQSSNLTVIFSFPLKGDRILAGWRHSPWEQKVSHGFRPGTVPLLVRMQRAKNNLIEKIRVERIDRKRLFMRGGTGIPLPDEDISIAIIGCGSLGSPLAVSLSKCGIARFLLIDQEKVEAENVARHVCGFLEAGSNIFKSGAVRDRLLKHFPYIECNAYRDEVLDLLRENESLLNKYDLIIVATGDKAVERRLNYLLRKGVITSPLMYVWMEPFGVAGQILYIHPNKGGCYQCCFDNGEFRYSVAKSSKEFYKRECGCQSTFVQYSNLEIDHFISIVAKQTINFLKNKPDCSQLNTWLGDLFLFKSLGYQIRDEWLADSAYTVHEKTISKNEGCNICHGP